MIGSSAIHSIMKRQRMTPPQKATEAQKTTDDLKFNKKTSCKRVMHLAENLKTAAKCEHRT